MVLPPRGSHSMHTRIRAGDHCAYGVCVTFLPRLRPWAAPSPGTLSFSSIAAVQHLTASCRAFADALHLPRPRNPEVVEVRAINMRPGSVALPGVPMSLAEYRRRRSMPLVE
jgi:hypothetical protein